MCDFIYKCVRPGGACITLDMTDYDVPPCFVDVALLKTKPESVANVPLDRMVSQPLAYVGLACGRQYLKVAEVIVAVEGDICRDPMIPDEYRHQNKEHHLAWSPDMLEYAAKTINEKVG